MAAQSNLNDTPIEIQGYETDPLRRGYQYLTNYESTYWRALVGRDAWALYEVLRSFCHKENTTCNPSVTLLIAILGLEDRRVLTGRVKKVGDKEYTYPGLIEILQHSELATAEVKGEGPEMRYSFHVNLTPPLLTHDQLATLSPLLQQKHAELLIRCEEAKQQLKDKRRAPKVPREKKGGMGNSHTPLGNSHTNNTQLTTPNKQATPAAKLKNNNNSGGDRKQGVVVALIKKGMSESVAKRLASRHNEAFILERVEWLEYLLETDPDKATNPAGWLRAAIEQKYAAPAGYKSKAEREREATEQKQRQEDQQRLLEAQRQNAATEQAAKEEERAKLRQTVLDTHATAKDLVDLWEQNLLPRLQSPWLQGSLLLRLEETTATLWLPNAFMRDQVERQFLKDIYKILARHLKVHFSEITVELVCPEEVQPS